MKKTTQELLELMKNSRDYKSYKAETKDEINRDHMKVYRALNLVLKEKGLKKSDVITRSCIENHYAYQIFSGEKNPTRDKVLMLCIGLEMSFEEVQNLLKTTGYAQLYGRDERDGIIIFGLQRHMNVIDINSLLEENNYDFLL